MISVPNILKNSLALSLIGTMAYGAYLLAHLKPPITQGLTVIGGNYLVNGTAKELINETCGDYVWDENNPKMLNLLFYSWIFGSSNKAKKPQPKKNEMGKVKKEWEECVRTIPNKI